MEPTSNDVLSGRGAWCNQHPGNKLFRKMLDERKDAYMTGTKKQKMNISNSIVEAIHSMDPPGRFLKQCPENGQWSELSNKAATDKAAQAMAWVIRGESLKQKRRDRRSRLCKGEAPSLQSQDSVNAKSPQSTDPPSDSDDISMPPPPSSSSLVPHCCESLAGTRDAEVAEGNKPPGEVEPTSNLHSQLPHQSSQLSATATTIPTPTRELRHQHEHNIPSMLQPLSLHQQHLFSHPTVQNNAPSAQTQIGFLSTIALNRIQQQLFSQHLLNHHQIFNCPPMSLPPTIIASNDHPLLAGTPLSQSAQTQSNRLHNPLQQFCTQTFRSGLYDLQLYSNSFAGLPSISWGQQQPDQYQLAYLLMLQRNQLLVPSNNILSTHRLQLQQLGLQLQSPSLLNSLNQAQAAQSQLNTEDSSTTTITTTSQISPSISSSINFTMMCCIYPPLPWPNLLRKNDANHMYCTLFQSLEFGVEALAFVLCQSEIRKAKVSALKRVTHYIRRPTLFITEGFDCWYLSSRGRIMSLH